MGRALLSSQSYCVKSADQENNQDRQDDRDGGKLSNLTPGYVVQRAGSGNYRRKLIIQI